MPRKASKAFSTESVNKLITGLSLTIKFTETLWPAETGNCLLSFSTYCLLSVTTAGNLGSGFC